MCLENIKAYTIKNISLRFILKKLLVVTGDFDILVYDILSCSNNSLGVLKDCSNQVSGH